METSTPAAPRWRRLLLQWGPFLVLGVVLLVLIGIDRQLKHTDLRGYALADAGWKLESDDLPQSWTQWEESDEYALLQESAPPFLNDVVLSVRKVTGVRPTPRRLRFWLGRAGVLSGNAHGWVLSCRPGVAMRVASFFHRSVAQSPAEATYRWGDVIYGWRDGFLLVGSSVRMVQELAQAGLPVERGGQDREGIALAWEGPHGGRLRIAAEAGLPFRLALNQSTDDSQPALHYTAAWPEAMFVLNAVDDASVAALRGAAHTLATWIFPDTVDGGGLAYMQAWWRAQLPPLPALECGGERAWVAFPSQEAEDQRAIEVGGIATRCAPPTASTLADMDIARRYQWEEQPGWLLTAPPYSRPRAVAMVEDTLAWTNEPSRMPVLLRREAGVDSEAQLFVRAQWAPTMGLARAWLLELAEQELIPGYHTEDLKQDWLPYVDALGAWSRLEATGRFEEGHFLLEGYLTHPDHR